MEREFFEKNKRIVVDCITENGPVSGTLWIFSYSKPGTETQETVEHVETSVEKQKSCGECGDRGTRGGKHIKSEWQFKDKANKIKGRSIFSNI